MDSLGLAARTFARYLVPLAIVTVVVLAPVVGLALRVRPPADLAGAQRMLRLAWILAGSAWAFQLVLVGAAAPLARALAAGAPVSQLRALGLALAGIVRGALPCLAAIGAVLVGGLALVVPGVALLVLFSVTGASRERGMPAPLVDSAAVVRAQLPVVAAIVAAMLAVDLALAFGAWKVLDRTSAARVSAPSRAIATRGSSTGVAFGPNQIARHPTPSAPTMSAGHESPMWTGRASGTPSVARVCAKIAGAGFSTPTRPESTIARNGSAMPTSANSSARWPSEFESTARIAPRARSSRASSSMSGIGLRHRFARGCSLHSHATSGAGSVTPAPASSAAMNVCHGWVCPPPSATAAS